MKSLMTFAMGAALEGLLTEGAGVWSLTSVNPHVDLELRIVIETLVTDGANRASIFLAPGYVMVLDVGS